MSKSNLSPWPHAPQGGVSTFFGRSLAVLVMDEGHRASDILQHDVLVHVNDCDRLWQDWAQSCCHRGVFFHEGNFEQPASSRQRQAHVSKHQLQSCTSNHRGLPWLACNGDSLVDCIWCLCQVCSLTISTTNGKAGLEDINLHLALKLVKLTATMQLHLMYASGTPTVSERSSRLCSC